MNKHFILLCIVLSISACSNKINISRQQFVGTWESTCDLDIEGKFIMKGTSLENYNSDGSLSIESLTETYCCKTNEKVESVKEVSKGTWFIDNGKLIKKFTEYQYSDYSSTHPDFTEGELSDITETLKEPWVETIVSIKPDEIVLKEDGLITNMKRIK